MKHIKKILFTIFASTLGILVLFAIGSTIISNISCTRYDSGTSYRDSVTKNDEYSPEMKEKSDGQFYSNEEMDDSKKMEDSLGRGRGGDEEGDVDNTITGKKTQKEDRLKVYFGFLSLRVDSVKEAKTAISALAAEKNGYVETSYENTIIIRIPKELFDEIMGTLASMGEVVKKSIETYDVTEFYQDLTGRLSIAERTRERLYRLLETTRDVKERLRILKEIKRLSEEIETVKSTLDNIKRLISFSRITIQLEQRLADISTEDKTRIPFEWIAKLDPFYTSFAKLDSNVSIKTGDEFAVFDKKTYFFAESTNGVRIRIASIRNTPEGDAVFWQKALEYHLAGFYRETQLLELGNFKAVQFKSKDAVPFYYITGVAVKDGKIILCEVLFPNQAAFDELGESVKGYVKESTLK